MALAVVLAAELVGIPGQRYDVVISFRSYCCGPDQKALDGIEALLRTYKQWQPGQVRVHTRSWGMEGEVDYCINMRVLDPVRWMFLVQASDIVRTSSRTRLLVYSTCPSSLY